MQKKNDVNSFVWKGEKIKSGDSVIQEEIKLVDAPIEKLQQFYNYCNTMLYNKSNDKLGRYLVLDQIEDQRNRCNAELCLRYLSESDDFNIPRYVLNKEIQKNLTSIETSSKDILIGDFFVGQQIPREFYDIPLNILIEGCIDKLGVFNRRHLKLSFILKQGLWLTQQEINDLTERDENGVIINRLDVVREKLNINKNIKFNINNKGLSYSQLRAMLQLKNKKYNDMTTEQLKTLRNRILFNLETEVKHHINQWEVRKEQIEKVAKLRNIELI